MRVHALWYVTTPGPESEIADIVFEADWRRLVMQFRGGLAWSEIHSVYTVEAEARAVAEALLAERDRNNAA